MKINHPIYVAPLSEEERQEIIDAITENDIKVKKSVCAGKAWSVIHVSTERGFVKYENFLECVNLQRTAEVLEENLSEWLNFANDYKTDKTFSKEEFWVSQGKEIWDIQISDSFKQILAGTYEFKFEYEPLGKSPEAIDYNLIKDFNSRFPVDTCR